MADLFSIKFLSKKISKVRFRPTFGDNISIDNNILAVGTWNDETNSLSLHSLPSKPTGSNTGETSNSDSLCSTPVVGDVTGLDFGSRNIIGVGTSIGNFEVLQTDIETLKTLKTWSTLGNAPISDVRSSSTTVDGGSFLICAEDGRIYVFSVDNDDFFSIETLYGQPVSCGRHATRDEVLIGTLGGHIYLLDLRTPNKGPMQTFSVSPQDQVGVMSMDIHPTQRHTIACGCEDGTLATIDLRSTSRYPVSLLTGHTAAVSDVCFWPHQPNEAITASHDGSVLWWKHEQASKGRFNTDKSDFSGWNPWLEPTSNTDNGQLIIDSILPAFVFSVNSLDVMNDVVVCGTDNEALFMFSNPGI